MAGFVPEHDDFQALVYRIASQVSLTFQDAETRLLADIAKRILADLPERPELAAQVDIVRALERTAAQLTAGITRDWAERVVARAIREGAAAVAVEQLPRIPQITPLADQHVLAASLVAFDLGNAFEDVKARILRYPRDAIGQYILGGDIYQDVIAGTVPQVMLGTSTSAARKAALQQFLERGVTGFTDIAGRNWRIGTYTEMATRTAVARAYTDAKLWRAAQLGIDLFSILGGNNACDHCAPWFGKILSTTGTAGPRLVPHAFEDRLVEVTVAGTIEDWRASGAGHPNCFPAFQPVASPTGLLASDSRWFEGEVVVIDTAGGRRLTVTPNHPVLTDRGWVAAGALVEGDDLLSYHGGRELVPTENPHHVGREATIGEVFESLRQSSEVASILVPGAAEQFHGDGGDAEVHVVLADRLLGHDGKPLAGEDLAESEFLISRVRERALLAERSAFEVSFGSLHAAHSVMSGSGFSGGLFGRQGADMEVGRFSDTADLASDLFEARGERLSADAGDGSELRDALTGLVSDDQIVNIKRERFAGHVYNLQTGGGWYLADSIVVHNCTCEPVEYLAGMRIPVAASGYDKAAHQARDRLRELEVRERTAKRKLAIAAAAGDRSKASREHARILTIQAETREHVAATGQRRRYERAQVKFADGGN